MSGAATGLPRRVAAMLRRLYPGRSGAEILGELDAECLGIRQRRGRLFAWLWAYAQLVRPQTWSLARELRTASAARLDRAGSGRARNANVSWLDLKLGFRMLGKHPGMNLIIVLALGVGIPASLLPHLLLDAALDAPLPFEDGDRVRAIVMWNSEYTRQENPRIDEYELWRGNLTSFDRVGAARRMRLNLIDDDGHSEPVTGAAVTASSFAITGVPPFLGRTLAEADELPQAPDVAVLAYELWRSRYGSDPDLVGATIRVAGKITTVVGVMPEGFAFPSSEQLWVPLRTRAVDFAAGTGPALWVYGRLSPDASVETAAAELESIGGIAVPDPNEPDETLVRDPQLVHFSALVFGNPSRTIAAVLAFVQLLPFFLLLIVCGNVAILLLARTANRTGEFAIRTALGAGRARLLTQLFIESLVPAVLATTVGMATLHAGLTYVAPLVPLPFWIKLGVSVEMGLKALGVAAVCAILAGVLPALKATAREVHTTLQGFAGTTGGLRFGRVADLLIIVEVALGVGALFGGVMAYRMFSPTENEQMHLIESDRFLVARVAIPRARDINNVVLDDAATHQQRVATDQSELRRLLLAEPGVRGVAISDVPPGSGALERRARFADDDRPADFGGYTIVISYVDLEFFESLGVTPRAGRLYEPADVPLTPGQLPPTVIVNSKFLERTGQTGKGVGRSLRLAVQPGRVVPTSPVFEIVGVVPDLAAHASDHMQDGTPMAYMLAPEGAVNPFTVVVDLGEEPTAFAPTFRRVLARTDPAALINGMEELGAPGPESLAGVSVLAIMATLSGIAITLSTAALYALMSFTIAQRVREIGIRTALGGSRARIVTTVARRALTQLAVGIGLGSIFWLGLLRLVTGGWGYGAASGDLAVATVNWSALLLFTACAVAAVGLTACLVPTLRGVRIRPVDALRTE